MVSEYFSRPFWVKDYLRLSSNKTVVPVTTERPSSGDVVAPKAQATAIAE
jgi:hypothetical protein